MTDLDKQVFRMDRGSFRGKALRTDDGFIRDEAVVTRTGVFAYRLADGTIRRELRHPEDVFKQDSLDTLKLVPITNGHPYKYDGIVNKDNAAEIQVGALGDKVYPDDKAVVASLQITRADGVAAVEAGRRELSCGYLCTLDQGSGVYEGEEYTHRQRNIKYNHVALVERARAGSVARLNLDSGDAIQQEDVKMSLKKVTLDGIEYECPPEVANALSKANTRADAAISAADKANGEKETFKAKLDEATAELDKLKNVDHSADIQKAVKGRIALVASASRILKQDELVKLDSATDREVMSAVIKAKHPGVKLDEATDVYVQARFDAVIEALPKEETAASSQRRAAFSRQDASDLPSSDKSKKDMQEGLTTQWKGEANK